MPQPPRIASARLRQAIVAVVMLLLLLATTGFAYMMVWQRGGQQQQRHDIGDLSFALPDYWHVHQRESTSQRLRLQLIDLHRPNRELNVTHLQLNEPATAQAVLRAATMPRLFQLAILRTGINIDVETRTLPDGRQIELALTRLYTQDRRTGMRSMTFTVVLTHDRLHFWEFVLREDSPPNAQFNLAQHRNDQFLSALFDSIAIH